MWPFARKPLVEPEMTDWLLDHAEWLLGAHSRRRAFAGAQLVPVSDRMFPTNGLEGHALAAHLFGRVRELMGVADLRLALVPDEAAGRYDASNGGIAPQWRSMPAGTYSSGLAEISYDVGLLKRLPDLVAVLSHEIAHAVLDGGASHQPPSDEDFDELLTDFTSVFLGFGLFQLAFRKPVQVRSVEDADAARSYYAFYMNRREAGTATALFALVHGIEPALVLRTAEMELRPTLKHAFKDLAEHAARIEELRQLRAEALPVRRAQLRIV